MFFKDWFNLLYRVSHKSWKIFKLGFKTYEYETLKNSLTINICIGYILVLYRGAGVFLPGGQNFKKGHFFVVKALPTKANFGSHAAI